MKRPTYEQAREDHEYLWSIAPAWDMTGGYGEGEELTRLMQNPTKKQATKCYVSQIYRWFEAGLQDGDQSGDVPWHDEKVREIASRYCVGGNPYDEDDEQ